jgi:hypothetical protein
MAFGEAMLGRSGGGFDPKFLDSMSHPLLYEFERGAASDGGLKSRSRYPDGLLCCALGKPKSKRSPDTGNAGHLRDAGRVAKTGPGA